MNPLDIAIRGKNLVIKIGLDTLGFVACHGRLVHFDVETNEFIEPKITDAKAFADEVVLELCREEEDGTTLVHEMFDKAFERAVENGAEGIWMPSDDR